MKQFNLLSSLFFLLWFSATLFASPNLRHDFRWQSLQGPRVDGRFNIVVMKNNNALRFAYSRNSTNTDIYKSVDGGYHWQLVMSPNIHTIHDVISIDQNSLMLAAENKIYVSQDSGKTWVLIKTFDESCDKLFSPTPYLIFLITNNNTNTPKLYRSTDRGQMFTRSYLGINEGVPFSTVSGDENILMIGTDRLLISTDQGLSWKQASSNWANKLLSSVAINHQNLIFIAANNKLYQTDTKGQIFRKIPIEMNDSITELAIDANDNLYVVDSTALYRSKNGGKTWELLHRFNQIIKMNVLENGKILVNTDEGLLESDETQINYFKLAELPFVASINTHVLALDSRHYFATVLPYFGPLYGSNDAGHTWRLIRNTAVIDVKAFNHEIVVLEYNAEHQQIMLSNDEGRTWQKRLQINNNYCYSIASENGGLIVNCRMENYFSEDLAHWLRLNIKKRNPSVMSYFSGKTIYVTDGYSIQYSTDKGSTWKYLLNNLNQHRAYIAGYNDNVLVIAIPHVGVMKMSQSDKQWHVINTGLSNFNFTNLMVIDADHYLLSSEAGIFYTKNGGEEWKLENKGLKNSLILDTSIHEKTLLAGTEDSGVYRAC